MSRLCKAVGVMLALVLGLMAPAASQDFNRGFSIKEYEETPALLPGGGFDRNVLWYHHGLIAGLQAAKEEHAAAGQMPLFCLPYEIRHLDLVQLIEGELEAEGHAWRRASGATAAKIALYVVQRKYPCPAPAGAKEGLWDPGFKVRNFRLWMFMANAKQRKNEAENVDGERLTAFLMGMREALMATGEAYVAKGAKRRLCIPSGLHAVDLANTLAKEFDRDAAYWDQRKEESIGPVAVQVFARQWPCK